VSEKLPRAPRAGRCGRSECAERRFDGGETLVHRSQGVALGHQQRCQYHVPPGKLGDHLAELRRSSQAGDARIGEPAAFGDTLRVVQRAAGLAADPMHGDH
jgi:hypothetical protein